MKCKKKVLNLMLAAALAVCLFVDPTVAAAEPVEPMEISHEALLSIAEELQEVLKIKADHLDIYSASREITDMGKEAAEIFGQACEKSHILAIDTGRMVDQLMGEQFVETVSREEILLILGGHIGNTVISMANTRFGAENAALNSMLTAAGTYVADLDREYLLLLEYTGSYSLAVNVFPSGEHVITASESVILTEAVPQILDMLSGAVLFEESSDPAKAEDVLIDYGSSGLYSQEDMEEAVRVIVETFSGWEGCELHAIRYAGDDCCSQDTLSWMNSLDPGCDYTQCIEFISAFHSPVEEQGAWEPDREYTDWQWWLARAENGSWKLLTWGY